MVWDSFTILGTHLDGLALGTLPGAQDPKYSDPTSVPPGSIWVLKFCPTTGDPLELQPAQILGRPAGRDFHPHGFGRFNDLLFVINHAFQAGGELVERFRVLPRLHPHDPVVLQYLSCTNFTDLAHGVLNDVQPVGEDEFFATQWLPTPTPIQGHDLGLLAELQRLQYMTSSTPLSSIWHGKDGAAQRLPHMGMMWNGITADVERHTLYVLDLLPQSIAVFSYAPGTPELQPLRRHDFGPYFGDNIEWDPVGQRITTGGMSNILNCFFRWIPSLKSDATNLKRMPQAGPSSSGAKCPSVVTVLDFSSSSSSSPPQVSHPLAHDGDLLGAFSAAVFINPTGDRETIVAGSFIDPGVLICHKQE